MSNVSRTSVSLKHCLKALVLLRFVPLAKKRTTRAEQILVDNKLL